MKLRHKSYTEPLSKKDILAILLVFTVLLPVLTVLLVVMLPLIIVSLTLTALLREITVETSNSN